MAATELGRLRISLVCDISANECKKKKKKERKEPLLILRFVEYKRHERMNVLV